MVGEVGGDELSRHEGEMALKKMLEDHGVQGEQKRLPYSSLIPINLHFIQRC